MENRLSKEYCNLSRIEFVGNIMGKAWFKIKKLNSKVWGIAEFGHNEKVISYLFVGKKESLLFDSGMGIDNIKNTVESITKLKVLVINSHCHFDHIGGNYQFENVLLLDNKYAKQTSIKGYTNKELKSYLKKNLFNVLPPDNFSENTFRTFPFKYRKIIKDNSLITIDPFKFKIVHAPGHSPDSICLYEKNNGFLLTGDTLYPGPIYLNLKGSNLSEYIKSVETLNKISKISLILPGHNSFTMDAKILNYLNLKIQQINKKKKNYKIDEKVSLILK